MHGRIDVPGLLARWRTHELDIAHSFKECGRLQTTDLEEILDATTFALLDKQYDTEEHLRAALHRGIKMRALRLHRDRITRRRALQQATRPAEETAKAWEQDPQRALVAREDRLIIREFLSELTPLEQQVFALVADGRSWRAIATALGMPATQARNTTRQCERKRERFFMLYQTGRLCGYRSQTIGALLNGKQTSDLALDQALAHLHHCHVCQTQYHTTEERLRAAFDRRALALLPAPPVVHGGAGIFDRLHDLLIRHARLLGQLRASQTGLRERLVQTIAGAGATTKIAVSVLSTAALATSTVNVQHHGHPTAITREPAPSYLTASALWQSGEVMRPATSQASHPSSQSRHRDHRWLASVSHSANVRPYNYHYVPLKLADIHGERPAVPASLPEQSAPAADASKASREFGLEHS